MTVEKAKMPFIYAKYLFLVINAALVIRYSSWPGGVSGQKAGFMAKFRGWSWGPSRKTARIPTHCLTSWVIPSCKPKVWHACGREGSDKERVS